MPESTTSSGDQSGENNNDDGSRDGAGGSNTNTEGRDEGKGSKEQLLVDLARERDRRQAAEREAKRVKDLEAELNKFREQSMTETEKAIAAAKREALEEAQKSFQRRLVQAEVRAMAAGKLNDPEDAIHFLDLDDVAVGEDGTIDKKALTKKLDDLVKAKPYLAGGGTRQSGGADQGARGGQQVVSSMNDIFRSATRR